MWFRLFHCSCAPTIPRSPDFPYSHGYLRRLRFPGLTLKGRINRLLQKMVLRLYEGGQATGLLSTGPGRILFDRAYHLYKNWLEAGPVERLRPLVAPGSTVVDIGANIGFFTVRFARWTGPKGRVLAFEPEAENFRRLSEALLRHRQTGWVEAIQAAIGERTGRARLRLNPMHPGDHRLTNEENEYDMDVPLVRLDDILAARGWPALSLVKIDVQGAEERVLLGAEQTLSRVRPAWFVEVDDDCLQTMGSSAFKVMERFAANGYAVRRVGRYGIGEPLDPLKIVTKMRPGEYEDLLFTSENRFPLGDRL